MTSEDKEQIITCIASGRFRSHFKAQSCTVALVSIQTLAIFDCISLLWEIDDGLNDYYYLIVN